jgi:hypothetical protein
MPSWTLEEFQTALSHEEFYDSVKQKLDEGGDTKDEKICAKYYYAEAQPVGCSVSLVRNSENLLTHIFRRQRTLPP